MLLDWKLMFASDMFLLGALFKRPAALLTLILHCNRAKSDLPFAGVPPPQRGEGDHAKHGGGGVRA